MLCFNDGHVVTNELDPNRLSDKLASEIYRQRWGVEVQLRDLKQTFERSKLLGRTPWSATQVATVELSWSVMGLWIAQLFAWKEQKDIPNLEAKPSIAKVLQILRQILRRPDIVSLRGGRSNFT